MFSKVIRSSVGFAVVLAVALTIDGVASGASSSTPTISYWHSTGTVQPNSRTNSYAPCPSGTVAIGGGYNLPDSHLSALGSSPYHIDANGPTNAWRVDVFNYDTSRTLQYTLYAVCARSLRVTAQSLVGPHVLH